MFFFDSCPLAESVVFVLVVLGLLGPKREAGEQWKLPRDLADEPTLKHLITLLFLYFVVCSSSLCCQFSNLMMQKLCVGVRSELNSQGHAGFVGRYNGYCYVTCAVRRFFRWGRGEGAWSEHARGPGQIGFCPFAFDFPPQPLCPASHAAPLSCLINNTWPIQFFIKSEAFLIITDWCCLDLPEHIAKCNWTKIKSVRNRNCWSAGDR